MIASGNIFSLLKCPRPVRAPADSSQRGPSQNHSPNHSPNHSQSQAQNPHQADQADQASAKGKRSQQSEVQSQLATMFDEPEILAQNMLRFVSGASEAMARLSSQPHDREKRDEWQSGLESIFSTLSAVGQYWLSDPSRSVAAQSGIWSDYARLWQMTARRMAGEESPSTIDPAPGDRRFSDSQWTDNEVFDFLKQFYLLTERWARRLVDEAQDLDPHTRRKAQFYVARILDAVSPSNFVLTNPMLLRHTLESQGENLAKGMESLAEDIDTTSGHVRFRQSDNSQFKLGENLAITPGKVVAQNEICQLIQYSPTTEKVARRPLLIIPPWINKFYILDLNPQRSFVKWAIEQGHTVFIVSWVNPDARHADKDFADYIDCGILQSIDHIRRQTGETSVNAIGYCVGGTLLAMCLAMQAATGKKTIHSATFFATQVDFAEAGDLKVFVDEEQVAAIEKKMEKYGYLDGRDMSLTFNLLRANDLIWPYIIGNYLRGETPPPMDLFYWNADSTRLPKANHSYYLRNCYLNNRLTKGDLKIGDIPIDLGQVTIPLYMLATQDDHIAPARSVYRGAMHFGGKKRFVLGGSGHIAGVINPPSRDKYGYWTGPMRPRSFDKWRAGATAHPGSWWMDWAGWIDQFSAGKTDARPPAKAAKPGTGGSAVGLEDAPGSYVRVRY